MRGMEHFALKQIVTPSGAIDVVAERLSLWGYFVFLVKRRLEIAQPGVMGVIRR